MSGVNETVASVETPDVDAVVVGAGFSGLYAIHKLRTLGLTVRAFERGDGVGGTWYWNRYPGLQCDTESLSYSFTFDEDLYREWTWTRRFAPQGEILDYANWVAERLDLRRHITFSTEVTGASWDEDAGLWRIRASDGSSVSARYFLPAPGPLSAANRPNLPSLESFAGEVYHTGQWPHEPVDLSGKRIAVVGTGSSGVQLITALAPVADQLVVFQRTPQYVMPTVQRALTDAEVRGRKDDLAALVDECRTSIFGAPGAAADRSVFDDTPEEREGRLEEAWAAGAQTFPLGTYNDFIFSEEANAVPAAFVRRKIAEVVTDPETARKLTPTYFFATKRPVQADGYYDVYNRPNVRLVATREEPIIEVTPTGIRTSEGEYELDAIAFATGFDAYTGPLFALDIRGRDGVALQDRWKDGAEIAAFLGISVPGFPNMFMVQGPQSLSVMANFLFGIQVNVDFIGEIIERMQRDGATVCEADEQSATAWAQQCQDLVSGTLIPRTESWWMGANIEGKQRPRFFPNYIAGVKEYLGELDRVTASDFAGLTMRTTLAPASA